LSGSIEFAFEAEPVLAGCDVAVVVAEADEKKIFAQLVMRKLDELGVPRILFLNKIDKNAGAVRDTLKLLQPTSSAFAVAPDSTAQGWRRYRLDRSSAGAGIYLPRICRKRDRRDTQRREGAGIEARFRCWKRWPITTTS
jgi:hypothetical protein